MRDTEKNLQSVCSCMRIGMGGIELVSFMGSPVGAVGCGSSEEKVTNINFVK